MKTNRSSRKNRLRFAIILSIIGVLLIGGAVGAFYYLSDQNAQPDTTTTTDGSTDVNYDPPTQQEVDAGQDAKKDTLDTNDGTSQSNNGSTSNKAKVQVGVSYADIYNKQLEIRAFTNGVIEGNGTCTATVTKGSSTITQTSEAFIDASSSQCRPIYIPQSKLTSGTWKVTVAFSSSDKEGVSDVVEVVVP